MHIEFVSYRWKNTKRMEFKRVWGCSEESETEVAEARNEAKDPWISSAGRERRFEMAPGTCGKCCDL